jgi:hypothetical protein
LSVAVRQLTIGAKEAEAETSISRHQAAMVTPSKRPGSEPGRRGGQKLMVAETQPSIGAKEAEAETSISRHQTARWRKRLLLGDPGLRPAPALPVPKLPALVVWQPEFPN